MTVISFPIVLKMKTLMASCSSYTQHLLRSLTSDSESERNSSS